MLLTRSVFLYRCYALDVAIARLKKGASKVLWLLCYLRVLCWSAPYSNSPFSIVPPKTIVPPPTLPVHSGTLLCLDTSMKWKRKYVVLTEDGLYMHSHRRVGFKPPQKYNLTPNCMLFSTVLKEYSFEVSSHVTVSIFSHPVVTLIASATNRYSLFCSRILSIWAHLLTLREESGRLCFRSWFPGKSQFWLTRQQTTTSWIMNFQK